MWLIIIMHELRINRHFPKEYVFKIPTKNAFSMDCFGNWDLMHEVCISRRIRRAWERNWKREIKFIGIVESVTI